MQAAALRKMFETVLPAEAIREAVVRLGVQNRRRDLDPVALIYALVLQGGTWECGRIATAVGEARLLITPLSGLSPAAA